MMPSTNESPFESIARTILSRRIQDRISIKPWLVGVWPWSWVQHKPLRRSALIAAISFLLVAGANASHFSFALALKIFFTAAVLFFGLINGFWVSAIFADLFLRLREISLMPKSSFVRWYAAGIAEVLGSLNLYAHPSKYSASNLYREDRLLLVCWLTASVCITPVAWYFFAVFAGGGVGAMAYAALMAAAIFSTQWALHFLVAIIRFAFTMTRTPVRYYPQMPPSASLKVIARAYMSIAALYSATYICLLAIAFLSRVPLTTPRLVAMSIPMICVFASVVITQFAIAMVFREQKHKRLVEYSVHVEDAFQRFMKQPSRETCDRVEELRRYRRVLRSLPGTAFSLPSAVAFAALVMCNLAASVGYYLLARRGIWIGP